MAGAADGTLIGVGFAITPLAKNVYMLYAFRSVYAIGAAAATGMLATIIADYAVNADRGKATGVMGLMNGMGAGMCAVFLAKLPGAYVGMGLDGPPARCRYATGGGT